MSHYDNYLARAEANRHEQDTDYEQDTIATTLSILIDYGATVADVLISRNHATGTEFRVNINGDGIEISTDWFESADEFRDWVAEMVSATENTPHDNILQAILADQEAASWNNTTNK